MNKIYDTQYTTRQLEPQAHISSDKLHNKGLRNSFANSQSQQGMGGVGEALTNERNPPPDSDQSQRCFGADAPLHPRTQRTACSLSSVRAAVNHIDWGQRYTHCAN